MPKWIPHIVLTAAFIPLLGTSGRADGKWLDAEQPNWNKAKVAVPRAPMADTTSAAHCARIERPPTTAGDRALMAAGWRLVGSLQTFGSLSVAVATSDFDPLCRPVGYQVFAFVDDVFAGTLSPGTMATRTDGAFASLRLVSATELRAEFVRYEDAQLVDETSEMGYRINTSVSNGPLLVPTGP